MPSTSDFQGPVLGVDPPDPRARGRASASVLRRRPRCPSRCAAWASCASASPRRVSRSRAPRRWSPSSTKTFTRVGRLNRLLRGVVYRLDRRRIGVSRRAPYRLAMPPRMLASGKRHTLTVTAFGRDGTRAKLNVPFRTAPCVTQFIANYRSNTRRGALRLRVDSKRSLRRVTFFTPSGMLPPASHAQQQRPAPRPLRRRRPLDLPPQLRPALEPPRHGPARPGRAASSASSAGG